LIFNSRGQYDQAADFIGTEEIRKRIYKIFPERFPYVISDGERERVKDMIRASGADRALVDNIGHTDIAKELGLELFGNYGLNITNSYALEEYKNMGFGDIILSPELNFAQIRDIKKCVNCGIVAYGRTHVMISENCLQAGYIADKTGAKFLVQNEFGNRSIIYNSVPVYLADRKDLYKNLGLFFIALNFTDEKPDRIKQIISDYALNKENIKPPDNFKFTRGYK
jgi:putative protease